MHSSSDADNKGIVLRFRTSRPGETFVVRADLRQSPTNGPSPRAREGKADLFLHLWSFDRQ